MMALLMSYAGMICLAISVNLLPVFLTTLSADMGGLTHEQLGRLGAVTFTGLVVAVLLTGPLADRFGPRRFAVLGNLLVAGGLAMLGLAPSYAALLAASFLLGLGAGTLDMVLSPIVAALQPRRRTMAMNLLHSFYCTGAVLTILAAALALRYGLGWRGISLALIAGPLLVALAFCLVRVPPLVADGNQRTSLRLLVRQCYFLVALVAIFLGGATEMGMAYWLPDYAEKGLGFSQWTAGMGFLGFSLAMAVGRIAVGVAGGKVNAIHLLLGCCAGAVVLFALASFAPWPTVALTACVLAGLTGSALWPSVLAIAADRYPHGGASMFGLLSALGNFGGIVMPWVVGVVADWRGASNHGLAWGLATAMLCPAAMIVCLLWMNAKGATPEGVDPGGEMRQEASALASEQ